LWVLPLGVDVKFALEIVVVGNLAFVTRSDASSLLVPIKVSEVLHELFDLSKRKKRLQWQEMLDKGHA
jgi:hypothetical protein